MLDGAFYAISYSAKVYVTSRRELTELPTTAFQSAARAYLEREEREYREENERWQNARSGDPTIDEDND